MVNWNSDADAKLLLLIIKVSDVKVDYVNIAKQFGEGKPTPSYVSQYDRC